MATLGVSLGTGGANLCNADADKGLARFLRMKALGITSVRVDFRYTTGSVATYDAVVKAALNAGLTVLGILDTWHTPTNTQAQFVTFCQNMVTTYAPLGVHLWEILNEQNFASNWDPTDNWTNPASYAALVQAAYPAIKAIDGTATVILGGLAPASDGAFVSAGNYTGSLSPITFLTQLYTVGGVSASFDAVSMHAYSWPVLPGFSATWNAWQQMNLTTPSLRSVMTANGDTAKKIWITEFGAPTGTDAGINPNPNPVSFPAGTHAFQASCYANALTYIAANTWAGPMYVFSLIDNVTDGDFGLFDSSGNAKPALAAVAAGNNSQKAVRALTISGGTRYRLVGKK